MWLKRVNFYGKLFWLIIVFARSGYVKEEKLCLGRNFFCYQQDFSWPKKQSIYSKKYLSRKPKKIFTYYQVVRQSLAFGFDSGTALENLSRAYLDQHVAMGSVTPALNIKFQAEPIPIQTGAFFNNLLGSLLPSNWMSIVSARFRYRVARLVTTQLALNKYKFVTELFLEAQRLKQVEEVFSFHQFHFSRLINNLLSKIEFKNIHERQDIATIQAYYSLLKNQLFKIRQDRVLAFIRLAEDFSPPIGLWQNYDIENFTPKLLKFKLASYANQQDFINIALDSSLENRALKELKNEASLARYITVSKEIIPGSDPSGLGISFGYHTVPEILKAKSRYNQSRINIACERQKIRAQAERALFLNSHIDHRLRTSFKSLSKIKQIFASILNSYDKTGVIHTNIHEVHERFLAAQLNFNNLKFEKMRVNLWVNILLVLPVLNSPILSYLPGHKEVDKLVNWLKKRDTNFRPKQDKLDEYFLSLAEPKELIIFVKLVEEDFGPEMVKLIIENNISELIKKTASPSFKKYLKKVVKAYGIKLSRRSRLALRARRIFNG